MTGVRIAPSGVDISPTAIKKLKSLVPRGIFSQLDIEQFDSNTAEELPLWSYADVVSMIEFLYYLGDTRPWKESFMEVWNLMTVGTVLVIADSLIPYQYRDFPKTLTDAKLIDEFTDTSIPVAVEHDEGRTWTRWLKVRIYEKVLC